MTEVERERIKKAAAQSGASVSGWAELALTDLSMVEVIE